jgi:low affinity Fe/Cu permease
MSARVPRGDRRTAFDRFAESVSKFVSRAPFFAVSLAFVIVWLPTIFVFESVDTWQLVINTVASILAFLLIALLQNSERRYDEALHRKIDVLTAALAELLEESDRPDERRRQLIEELRAAARLEERL